MDGGREVGRSHKEEGEQEGRGGPPKRGRKGKESERESDRASVRRERGRERKRVRWFQHPRHHPPSPLIHLWWGGVGGLPTMHACMCVSVHMHMRTHTHAHTNCASAKAAVSPISPADFPGSCNELWGLGVEVLVTIVRRPFGLELQGSVWGVSHHPNTQ